jgi:flagellar hook-associated protein 3 FlgL
MSRVATLQHSQVLLNDMLNNQKKVQVAQQQVSTGHVAETYKDIHQDIPSLSGAKSLLARLEQHQTNNSRIFSRMAAYDQSLAGMERSATDIKEAVMGAINTSSGLGLYETIEGAFDSILGFLNIKPAEGYIYGGTKTDAPPVNITDINDLLTALEPPTDIFDNNTLKATVRIDDNRTMEFGMLANEVGLDIMQAIQRIAMWENGTLATTVPVPTGVPVSFGDPLDADSAAFLIGEIANLEALIQNLGVFRGENGLNQKTIEATQERIDAEVVYARDFISNIEDVDAAEAITKLNQANFALEASYNVLSQVNRISLLNFL